MGRFNPSLLQLPTTKAAVDELKRIGVDGYGIGEMVPKMRTVCIRLSRLDCRQANILKQEMLSLGGDAAVTRGTVACSVDKTDCVLIGTVKQLTRLCGKLQVQPFGLPDLAGELNWLLQNLVSPPAEWHTSRRTLSLKRPLVMGILNLTPDSFSDGGRYNEPDRAVETALRMETEGADIIDIGGESTRPGSATVTASDEIDRIIPVIGRLSRALKCPISVDTWKSPVAAAAVVAGAEIINDISGFTFDSLMADVAAESGAAVVLMHTRGKPQVMQCDTLYTDLMSDVLSGLRTSVSVARNAGISDNRIAVDPGIGFGKDVAGNLEIVRRLAEIKSLGLPILVGPSRKSFIGSVLGKENTDDRLFGTAAVATLSVFHGASILRVHDVKAMRDVVDMAYAFTNH